MTEKHLSQLKELINNSTKIVVLQADNPDGDSLASALALEEILGELGKDVTLVCGIDMPAHLKYLSGWSRVSKEIPNNFDMAIVVDANSIGLFEVLDKTGQLNWVKTKPLVVLDHHMESDGIEFADLTISTDAVATGQLIYQISQKLDWQLTLPAKEYITISIMSDSLGLTSEGTTAETIHIIAQLVEGGVSISKLDQARRELMRKEPELVYYKGRLLQRVEYFYDNKIAIITIPWDEIEQYSSLYNPSMLVIDDMRLTVGTDVAIAFKIYRDGKVTGKIRCNNGKGIAAELAVKFGGGGHPYASGFKTEPKVNFEKLKTDVITKANELLTNLAEEK